MSDFGKGINVPSKDIVYRQDVEDMLRNALPSRGMWEIEGDVVKNTICETVVDLMMDLEKLPSAQPEPQWIPCSERLPEDYTDVLVWFEYFRYGNYNCLYQMYGIGSYSSEYDSWLINQETGWNELKVFAWMPLPEPYKGEQE